MAYGMWTEMHHGGHMLHPHHQQSLHDMYRGMDGMNGGYPGHYQQHQEWPSLDEDLTWRLDEVCMTHKDETMVQACLEELQQALASLGPEYQVRKFGSIANGFARHGSDLDATCTKSSKDDPKAVFSALDLQLKVLPMLRANQRFRVIEEIWAARVPIVKLRFDEALDVDLSANNLEPLSNTHLLNAYAGLDPRVKELGILIKLWAKANGISGAVNGNLSAYAFTLMVIYFMQTDETIKMPVLDVAKYDGENESPDLPPQAQEWSCRLTKASLVRRFFTFYTKDFEWSKEVVSVRLGERTHASNSEFTNLPGRMLQRIHIEDPFLLNRNLHCVLRLEQEEILWNQFLATKDALDNQMAPEGLRSSWSTHPWAPPPPRPTGLNPDARAFDLPIPAAPTRPPGNLAIPPKLSPPMGKILSELASPRPPGPPPDKAPSIAKMPVERDLAKTDGQAKAKNTAKPSTQSDSKPPPPTNEAPKSLPTTSLSSPRPAPFAPAQSQPKQKQAQPQPQPQSQPPQPQPPQPQKQSPPPQQSTPLQMVPAPKVKPAVQTSPQGPSQPPDWSPPRQQQALKRTPPLDALKLPGSEAKAVQDIMRQAPGPEKVPSFVRLDGFLIPL